jgi:hypothetical protein
MVVGRDELTEKAWAVIEPIVAAGRDQVGSVA